jgi:hypothetical protein
MFRDYNMQSSRLNTQHTAARVPAEDWNQHKDFIRHQLLVENRQVNGVVEALHLRDFNVTYVN